MITFDDNYQVGCGYCKFENVCTLKRKDVNLAKNGCPLYEHWNALSDLEYDEGLITKFLKRKNIKDDTES